MPIDEKLVWAAVARPTFLQKKDPPSQVLQRIRPMGDILASAGPPRGAGGVAGASQSRRVARYAYAGWRPPSPPPASASSTVAPPLPPLPPLAPVIR